MRRRPGLPARPPRLGSDNARHTARPRWNRATLHDARPDFNRNTVVMQIGPVASISATEWLTYAAVVLDRVRASPPEGIHIPLHVLAAIETYVTTWTEVASRSTTFSRTGRQDPAILQAIAHHWFQLAELLTQESLVTAHNEVPPGGEPFYAALVSGFLVALATGDDPEQMLDKSCIDVGWTRSQASIECRIVAKVLVDRVGRAGIEPAT